MIFTTGVMAVMQSSRGGGEVHITHDWETLAPAYKGSRGRQWWTYMNRQLQMSNRYQNYLSSLANWWNYLGSPGCFSIRIAHWPLEFRYHFQLPGWLIWTFITNSMKIALKCSKSNNFWIPNNCFCEWHLSWSSYWYSVFVQRNLDWGRS